MPKLKLAIGSEAAKVEATQGFTNYEGPTPPKGVYPVVVKQIVFGESKAKNPMLSAILEIKAPKEDKRSKYNGYALFEYLVIPRDKEDDNYGRRVGDINAFLDAMAGGNKAARKALWGNEAVISDDKKPKIVKIGPIDLKVKGGIPIKVNTRDEIETTRDKETGETIETRRLRVSSYNLADEAKPAEADADEIDADEIDPSDIDPEDFVDDEDIADEDLGDETDFDEDVADEDEDEAFEKGQVDIAEVPDTEDAEEAPVEEAPEPPRRTRRKASF